MVLGVLGTRVREAIFWFEMRVDEDEDYWDWKGRSKGLFAENFVRLKVWVQEGVKSLTKALSAIYSD